MLYVVFGKDFLGPWCHMEGLWVLGGLCFSMNLVWWGVGCCVGVVSCIGVGIVSCMGVCSMSVCCVALCIVLEK